MGEGVVFRNIYDMRFEALVVYDAVDCEIAYGTLKISAIVMPALRLCLHKPVYDFAVKIYDEFVLKVKKTPYYLQIPPHRYVTYEDAPDVLLLMRPGGGASMLVCKASADLCNQLRDAARNAYDEEHVYTMIKSIVANRQEQRPTL